MRDNNNFNNFWNSDCFYEMEPSNIWELYHSEDRVRAEQGDAVLSYRNRGLDNT